MPALKRTRLSKLTYTKLLLPCHEAKAIQLTRETDNVSLTTTVYSIWLHKPVPTFSFIFQTVEVVGKNTLKGKTHDYLHFAFLLIQKMELEVMTVVKVVLVPSHLFDCMSVVSHDLFALEVEIHLSNKLGGWLDAS